MNFLDGLDEDFEVAPRQPRPVTSPLALVLRALVDADQPLPPAPPPPPAAAAPGLGAPWQALEGAVHAALHAVRAGDFTAVLRGEAARALLGPVQPSEWEVLPPSALASAAGLAQSGGLPSPGDFGYVCCTLLARRAARFALHGEGDEYYVDAPGSADTPRHWRAALAALVAAACLGLYTQANFTGPEVEREELRGIYPLPWAASLLPAGAEAAAGDSGAGAAGGGGGGGSGSGGGASGEGGSGALGLAPATLYSRRQWGEGWLLAEEKEGEEEAGSSGGGGGGAPAALPQQPPFFTAALELLAPPCLGDSAYPLTSLAHYLGTARALLGGLLRPVPRGAVGVAWEAVCEAREGAREDPRVAQLHELTDALPPLAWLAARAAVLNYRCLAGGGRGAGGGALLLAECAGLFARAAVGVCGEYGARVFGEGDVFQRGLVGGELESSGAPALRGSSSSAGSAAQRSFGDPLAEEEAAEEAAESAAILRARAARHALPGAALARPHAARLLLEWGLAQHAFKRTAGAKTSFFLAKAESSLRTLLTGAPGKRLKHQSFFTTQLMLRAASAGQQAALAVSQGAEALRLGAAEGRFSGPQAEGEEGAQPPQPPPATVLGGLREVTMAESDPRTEMLEAMRMAEGCSASELAEAAATKHELFYAKGWAASVGLSAPTPAPSAPAQPPAPPALADAPLSILDQCIVLALCLDVSNHNPEDGLTAEEMRPYVARVLDTPLNWSVHSSGLYARALLEFENHRTSDRAALQLAALADAAERSAARLSLFAPRTPGARGEPAAAADATALPRHRLAHAPALHLPSVWELKREVGERYLKLGAVRDALAVFSGLELWEEVLTCLRLLERPRKALATVRMLVASVAGDEARRLQLAAYLCASAALRDSDEEYARAWEVSGGRYAPAALALGRRCGARGEWARAETFLRAGLRVAPGDGGGWFLLGVAGMRAAAAASEGAALEGAAGAFGRCVQLDATRADAWANLGSIALQQRQWGRGYAALEQALKADKGDWRILSNFVTAAVRTGALSRAVAAMGALVALAVRGGKTGETGDEEGAVGEGGLHLPALTQVAKRVLDSCWARRRREGEEAAAAAAAAPGGSVLPPLPMSTALEEEEAEGGAAGAAARAAAAAAAAAAAEAAEVDLHAHACLEPLARLLDKVTGSLRPPATVWAIFADVEEARGRLGASQACRERQWRSLLAAPGWERSAPLLRGVVDCTQRLVVAGRALVELGLAARARTAEQARYYAATVRARVEADAEGLAEFEGFAGLAGALAAATAEE